MCMGKQVLIIWLDTPFNKNESQYQTTRRIVVYQRYEQITIFSVNTTPCTILPESTTNLNGTVTTEVKLKQQRDKISNFKGNRCIYLYGKYLA